MENSLAICKISRGTEVIQFFTIEINFTCGIFSCFTPYSSFIYLVPHRNAQALWRNNSTSISICFNISVNEWDNPENRKISAKKSPL